MKLFLKNHRDRPGLRKIEIELKNKKREKIWNTVNENHGFDLGIPEDNQRIRTFIPTLNLSLHLRILSQVDLSQEHLKEGKNLV
jgi:hypothetical protein